MTRNAAMLFLSTFSNNDSTLVLAAAIRSVTELTALPFACVITSLKKKLKMPLKEGQQKQPMFTTLWDVSPNVEAVWISSRIKF